MTDTLTSKQGVRARRKKVRLTAQQFRTDLKELMKSPVFHRVARELLGWTHNYAPSFQPGGDPLVTAFREGERNIGLRLFLALEAANPQAFYTQILLPGAHEKLAAERQRDQELTDGEG